jgi:phage terminase small subunit
MAVLKNAKHEAVAQAYIADPAHIAWRAYKAVYPKSSKHAAETAATRLLKNAEFKARVDELLAAAADATVMSAREVLQELSKLGRSNIQNCVVQGDDTSDVIEQLHTMAPATAATIQELTIETYLEGRGDEAREVKRVKVKLHDKRAALNDLGRHHKLFGGELELGGDVIVEIRKFGNGKPAGKAKRAA